MKLDRNNYEEYFLMYADGELSPADRKAVEQFVLLHPDLEEELDLLKEAVLDIDSNITMPNKHLLFKTSEWTEDTLTPQQKDLLLYIDNELPAAEKSKLETALVNSEALQKDLASLTKTKLVTEVVAMPEKEELYRHTSGRRVIPMMLRWMAAAAVMAGFGWYFISSYSGNGLPSENGELAVVSPKKTTDNTDNNGTTHTTTPDNTPNSGEDFINSATEESKDNTPNTQSTNHTPVLLAQNDAIERQSPNTPNSSTSHTGHTTGSQTEDIQMAATKAISDDAGNESPLPALASQYHITTAKESQLKPEQSIAYVPTATPSADNGSGTNNEYNETSDSPEYINIVGAHIKKQKIRGIFRSVTRTVGRAFDKSNVAQADASALR